MIVKTIDLTIRQIIEICDKHNSRCSDCPLFNSTLACHKFSKKYKDFCGSYNREILMEEEVDVDD